jgi:hypothetical protein
MNLWKLKNSWDKIELFDGDEKYFNRRVKIAVGDWYVRDRANRIYKNPYICPYPEAWVVQNDQWVPVNLCTNELIKHGTKRADKWERENMIANSTTVPHAVSNPLTALQSIPMMTPQQEEQMMEDIKNALNQIIPGICP